MKVNRTLPPIYRLVAALTLFVVGVSLALPTYAAGGLKTVPGEIILYLQPGTNQADAAALAARVGAQSTPMLLKDCYHLVLAANKLTDQDAAAAVAQLRADPRVRNVRQNIYHTLTQTVTAPTVTPNDPRFPEQWGLKLINMPQAWVLQKGVTDVNVAVIDSGFDVLHPDLQGRYSAGSMDLTTNSPIVTPDGVGPALQHGVHVSGIIVANANNGIGVASVTWENTLCVGLKVHKKGDADNALDGAAIINALQYCADNKDKLHIVAINESLGAGPGLNPADSTDPEYIATKNCTDKGIIVCVAAGNSAADDQTSIPAGYKFSPLIVTVAAVGQTGKQSSFSSFGKIDVAAPGGDFDNGDAGQILSTLDGGYGVESGTSQATPHVTGVAALLMSIPGVTPLQAVQTLEQTANHTGLLSLPDVNYGFGTVDAYAAIAKLAVRAIILSPDGVDLQGKSSDPGTFLPPPVETFKPTFSFHIGNVAPENVTFVLDAGLQNPKSVKLSDLLAAYPNGPYPDGITDFMPVQPANFTGPNPQYTVSFRVAFSTTGPFQHTVTVTAVDTNSGRTATDTRLFTVTPHTIPSGLSMISIPYFESAADSPTKTFRDAAQLLGTLPVLYRYLLPVEVGQQVGAVVDGAYAAYSGNPSNIPSNIPPNNPNNPNNQRAPNINASFHPLDSLPTLVTPPPNTSPIDTRPIGLGYFINAPAAIPVVTLGAAFPTSPFRIPLHEGWNIVGDPYPFPVPFNSTEVETPSGAHVPVSQAVDQKLILPYIYRLVGGDYQFSVLPDGTLEPWEGHWIYVVPKDPSNPSASTVISLIVTPTPGSNTAGRAAVKPTFTTAGRAIGPGSWKLQLQAHVGDHSDSNNFVGMSGNATDGNDLTKVPKPPKPDGTISLAIVRPDTPATVYAQDLRSIGGSKQWNIAVSTNKPNTDVTIEWPNARTLPKTYSLILTDLVTGSRLDLRNTSSYQFNSGASPVTRSFSLVARPTIGVGGHPVFTNIVVNPGRAGGRAQNVYNIGYSLSTSANVSISILTPGGHTVAQIVTRAVVAGDNAITWNGLDNAGRAVAAGSYVLQFQAATNDGQTTRVIRPLILTGRSQ
jgi:hypothetical protein